MTISPRAIEAAARAIAETRGAIWTRPDHTVSATFDHDAAVAALSAALAVDGLCLVPKEPSDDVLKAGYETMFDDKYNGTQAPLMFAVMAAMIAAASTGED